MMSPACSLRRLLLLSALLLAYSSVAGADSGVVYQRNSDDGTVELTNLPDSPSDYQTVVAAPLSTNGTSERSPSDYQTVVAAPRSTTDTSERSQDTTAPAELKKPASISESPMGDRLRELYNGAHAAHQAAGR
jgi:hypothetical protein